MRTPKLRRSLGGRPMSHNPSAKRNRQFRSGETRGRRQVWSGCGGDPAAQRAHPRRPTTAAPRSKRRPPQQGWRRRGRRRRPARPARSARATRQIRPADAGNKFGGNLFQALWRLDFLHIGVNANSRRKPHLSDILTACLIQLPLSLPSQIAQARAGGSRRAGTHWHPW